MDKNVVFVFVAVVVLSLFLLLLLLLLSLLLTLFLLLLLLLLLRNVRLVWSSSELLQTNWACFSVVTSSQFCIKVQ